LSRSLPHPASFIPHGDVGDKPNIIVDGAPLPSTVLTLSHWPNNKTPVTLKRDTSTQTAFAYLDAPDHHSAITVVSNNHFDEDGLFSMFVLCDPERALAHRDLLIDASMAGDFGICRNRQAARLCFTIEAFADPQGSPLPVDTFTGCEARGTAALYTEMLKRLPDILDDLESLAHFWRDQDIHLQESRHMVESGQVSIKEIPELDLAIVYIPEDLSERRVRRYLHTEFMPVHPFAINSATERNRILSIQGRCLQLQYRYESWVQFESRRPALRVDLSEFCTLLNELEEALGTWRVESPNDVVPRLFLEGTRESSIPAQVFVEKLQHYLVDAPVAWDPYNWTGH
jgi:hypothetical protein